MSNNDNELYRDLWNTPADYQPVYCEKCGAKMEYGCEFCTACGHYIATPAGVAAAAIPPIMATPNAAYPPPIKKSPLPLIISIVAGVLLIFGIGIAVFFMMSRSNDSGVPGDDGYQISSDGRGPSSGDTQAPTPDNNPDNTTPPQDSPTPQPTQPSTPQPTPPPTPPPTPIYIENPKIIITTRYNPSTGVFNAQDEHAASVRAVGATPVLPADDRMLADILRTGDTTNAAAIAELYDGLILTGGGDISARFFNQSPHPASGTPDEIRDTAELALCRAFVDAGKPILGINRGMQLLNVAMGGDLIQDIPDILGLPESTHSGNVTHTIQIERGSWLYDLFGSSVLTYSAHHQSIGILAPGFTIAAYTGPVIEAIENGNLLGIQFNPERLEGTGSYLVFSDFITRCSYVPAR